MPSYDTTVTRIGTAATPTSIRTVSNANGEMLRDVIINAASSTTAQRVTLYLYDGSNQRVLTSIAVPVTTAGATEALWTHTYTNNLLHLPDTWELRAEIGQAEDFDFTVKVKQL